MTFPREGLAQRVTATIRRCRMLRPGDVAGVAVSGGADSVALLLMLADLRDTLGIRLKVVHFNHMLRAAESDADENFVGHLAREKKFELIAGREDVAAKARKTGANLEDAARKCRYAFFSALVEARSVTRVCVAHTADDQAETVLAKIIRGTGPAGVAGIYPVAGCIVRPLIEVRRTELREYLESSKQSWREDSTNLDETRLRARIRRRLVPLLEKDFQGAIVPLLSQLAELSREDEVFWNALAEDRFRALVHCSEQTLSIAVPDLLQPMDLPAAQASDPVAAFALTSRLVRRILAELKGDRLGFTNRHVEDVLHLATVSTSGHRLDLPAGVAVERKFDELCFSRKVEAAKAGTTGGAGASNTSAGFEEEVSFSATDDHSVEIPAMGLRLRLKVIDWPSGQSETNCERTIADWSRLSAPVVVRNYRPGDAYRPQGRSHDRKLKQLFRERRIALWERRNWPVLTSRGRLVWARGFPIANEFVARAETRKALVISEEPL